MNKVELELTDDEVVEMVAFETLMEMYMKDKAKRARVKLMYAIRETIGQMEMNAFNEAVDRYRSRLKAKEENG